MQLQQAIQASLEDSHRASLPPSPAMAIHPDALAFSPRPARDLSIEQAVSDLQDFLHEGGRAPGELSQVSMILRLHHLSGVEGEDKQFLSLHLMPKAAQQSRKH